jgi:hypothetical protein
MNLALIGWFRSVFRTTGEDMVLGPLPLDKTDRLVLGTRAFIHVHASAWLDAGWKVESVDLIKEIVVLDGNTPNEHRDAGRISASETGGTRQLAGFTQ